MLVVVRWYVLICRDVFIMASNVQYHNEINPMSWQSKEKKGISMKLISLISVCLVILLISPCYAECPEKQFRLQVREGEKKGEIHQPCKFLNGRYECADGAKFNGNDVKATSCYSLSEFEKNGGRLGGVPGSN